MRIGMIILLQLADVGIDEVRVNVFPVAEREQLPRAIEALAPVVDLVHAG